MLLLVFGSTYKRLHTDLVFSFVDELLPDQTPESVHLMPSGLWKKNIQLFCFNRFQSLIAFPRCTDEIFVSLRKPAPPAAESPAAAEKKYPKQFKSLLESGAHADITFIVDEGKLCIRAHKAILSARSDYFDAMLREGGMSESFQSEISIDHDGDSFKRMLEYIYADEISDIKDCDADEVLNILLTANQFVMDDLRVYVEPYAAKLLSVENIAKFMLLSADKETSILREACIEYIHDRKQELAADSVFYREVESNPELGLLLFKYAVNPAITNSSTPDDPQVKRRRCSERIMPILSASTANSTNTNTIAQSNASVQEL